MKFFIPALVGAFIGYITNWLAIKMLFRPHHEKRIFGIKLPFTPGLIPKEKDRIAKSVGEAVGTHLLSTDVFVDALCSTEVKNQIKDWLRDKLNYLKNSSRTVYDVFSGLGNAREKIKDRLKENISKAIIVAIENNKEVLIDFINKNIDIKGLIIKTIDDIDIKNKLDNLISQLQNSNQSIKEVIPASIDGSIKLYIYSNRDKIAQALSEMLSNDNVKEKISLVVIQMVQSTLGKFASMFLSPELIGDKIISSMGVYLKNEENHHDIAMLVISLYEKFMKINVSDVALAFSEDAKQETVDRISSIIKGYTNNIIDTIDIDETLKILIEDNILKMQDMVYNITSNMVDGLLNLEFKNLLSSIDDKEIDLILFKLMDDIFEDFIKQKATKIIELIDVSKLVEDRINSFDVEFAEKIILDVANKELSAITWLGAILGAIMGIVSPLLQMI